MGAVPSGAPAMALPLLLPSQSSQTCTMKQAEPFIPTKVVITCTWDRAAPSCAPSGAAAAAKPSLLAPRRRAWRSSCGPSSSAGGSVEAARTLAALMHGCSCMAQLQLHGSELQPSTLTHEDNRSSAGQVAHLQGGPHGWRRWQRRPCAGVPSRPAPLQA